MDSTINNHRLVLGTAQLGLDYGIANKKGKPDPADSFDILRVAWHGGIRFFDTAQVYGESEAVLGRFFRALNRNEPADEPNIITKLKPDGDPLDTRAVLDEMDASLDRLGIRRLWGFMLHSESWLGISVNKLVNAIDKIKRTGKTDHFGVSVYSMENALKALEIDGIDIVQLPFNVFDQRAREDGVFDLAREKGKAVFIRSIYLQGLLLMTPERIPPQMNFCADRLREFVLLTEKFGISPKFAALAFVVNNAPDAFFVIGAESTEQVRENLHIFKTAIHATDGPELNSLSCRDPLLINPSFWNLTPAA